jgi:hypothetical protein
MSKTKFSTVPEFVASWPVDWITYVADRGMYEELAVKVAEEATFSPDELVTWCRQKEAERKANEAAALAEAFAQYEAATGRKADPNGPAPHQCSECGEWMQYLVDSDFGPAHSCYGIAAESMAAERFEDMAYGRD